MNADSPIQDAGLAALYEQDFLAWVEENVARLRRGEVGRIDVPNVIEELESLGVSQRRELHSRMRVLVAHLLKWVAQPARRSSSWAGTISEQRFEIGQVLDDSPSLRSEIPSAIRKTFISARRLAARDTGLPESAFPASCPFLPEQLLDDDFWPEKF